VEFEMTEDGRTLQLTGPVHAAAAITLNQTEDMQEMLRDRLLHQRRIAGIHKEFVLGGPRQDEVTQEFIGAINQSFAESVETALATIEGSK